jgi:hypothetical protein
MQPLAIPQWPIYPKLFEPEADTTEKKIKMDLNYIAPINSLGYGVVGLNILKAAVKAGHNVALWPVGGGADAPPSDHPMLREAFDRTRFFNPKAPSLRVWHQWDMAQHVGKGPHCGLPIFELDKFNDQELHHLKSLDIVFAPSHWAAQVLRENGIEDVVVAPFGVDRSIFRETPPSSLVLPERPDNPNDAWVEGLRLPDDGATTFLNIGKWEYRKGHDILLRAFNKAFSPKDNVRLIMCCYSPFLEKNGGNDEWRRCYVNSPLGRAGKIVVLRERLPGQDNLAALIHKADCGVFPSRAEGWNLDLLEVLSCGKHAIATDYSAHTEFCNNHNAWLIPAPEREVAEDGIWFHGQGQWASLGNKELDWLVEQMRHVHELKQSGGLKRNDAGIETAKRFSWDKTVSHIVRSFA